MIWRIGLLWLALCCAANAQAGQTPAWPPLAPAAGAAGCSAATTFLARTSGLSGTETSAYTTMICGMITDGVGCSAWAGSSGNIDALYIFATKDTTTAALNLCSTSFGITVTPTMTFTADTGWAGDGTAGFLNTNYTPSSAAGNCTQNACSFGLYLLTNRTSGAVVYSGGADANNFTFIIPLHSNTQTYCSINAAGGGFTAAIVSTARGSWICTRTGATADALYLNGNTTPVLTGSDSSLGLPTQPLYLGAFNGSGSSTGWMTDQMAAALVGGALNATQQAAISNRINAYMTTMGVNVY